MGFRLDFYSLLLDEVMRFSFDLPETSGLPFLARQMKENKKFAPGSAVCALRELDGRYDAKTIDEKEYFEGLLKTALQKKIRIQERMFGQILSCRDLFPYSDGKVYDRIHEESETGKEYRLFYRRTNGILLSLKGENKNRSIKDAGKIKRLSEMLMQEALVQEAKAFLYDAGFSVNQKEDRMPRKIDRSMQMVDAFFERKDTAYFLQDYDPNKNPSCELDRERIAETKKLFSLMDLNSDYDSAVVPVIIDPETGAGLYIYGIESDDREDPVYMNNGIIERRAQNGHHCFYTIFEYWGSMRDMDDSDYAPGRLIYRQYISNEGSRYESTGYIDLDDALFDYRKVIRNRIGDMFMYNEHAPADCPERFKKYFSNDEEYDEFAASDKKKIAFYQEEEKTIRQDRKEIAADVSHLHY